MITTYAISLGHNNESIKWENIKMTISTKNVLTF